jgi:predicted SAM-dependent methyltransferase
VDNGIITRLKRTRHAGLRWALLRAAAAARWCLTGHLVRAVKVRRYLAATEEPRLQIGAGSTKHAGWLNSDLISGDIYLDLGRRLPFRDGTFAYVFGEHVIEHIRPDRAQRLLRELHRVIRPGGVLRLTTPDLRKIIAIYDDRNAVVSRDEYSRFLAGVTGATYDQPARILNDYLRLWGHQHVYDEDDLTVCLRAAGFGQVVSREPGQSPHAVLQGIERHGGEAWVNRAEAMCLEATRAPAAGS